MKNDPAIWPGPFLMGNRQCCRQIMTVGIDIGSAAYPSDADNTCDLLEVADQRMSAVKNWRRQFA